MPVVVVMREDKINTDYSVKVHYFLMRPLLMSGLIDYTIYAAPQPATDPARIDRNSIWMCASSDVGGGDELN